MEILSVTLKNFKSHSDRHFHFEPGTNAICGENGAGKTSILEAIAWALFNYRGAYKNEDLIRNGSSSAQVTVAFISSRDGRTYEVQRCTTKGYTLYDPQLDQRLNYKHIEDEILPWLREHLGVAAGTDLARLFSNTVGVPQGTFTVDFLQSPENRKKVFDSILKVEEYKQASQEMLSLEKYAKAGAELLSQAIAQYDETLQAWAPLQQRRADLAATLAQDEARLIQLHQDLAQLQARKDGLTAQAQRVQQLEPQTRAVLAQLEGQRRTGLVLEQAVQRSRLAVQTCETHRGSYDAYLEADAQLQQLNQAHKQRQTWVKQRDTHQRQWHQRQLELTRLATQLESLTRIQQELVDLTPLIEQQSKLEQQMAGVVERLNQIQVSKLEMQTLTRQLTRLQGQVAQLEQEIQRLTTAIPLVAEIAPLEQSRDRLQDLISRGQAAAQFEAELRQLVEVGESKRDHHHQAVQAAIATLQQMQQAVPLLATESVDSALAAIQTGLLLTDELLDALHDILETLVQQTSGQLQLQAQKVRQQLETRYRQRAECAALPGQQQQMQQAQQEMAQIQQRMVELAHGLDAAEDWQAQRSQLMAALADLGDPRSRRQRLLNEQQSLTQVQQAHDTLQQAQESLAEAIAQVDEQLAIFADLDSQMERYQHHRQQHQAGYFMVVQHQKEAEALATVEQQWQEAIAQVEQLSLQHQAIAQQLMEAQQAYDADQHRQIEAVYQELQGQIYRIEGSLPQQQALLQELDQQLQGLQDISGKRDRARQDLKQKEQIRRFIAFARKAYREAGPRITERYVHTVSREADRLFRELIHRPNVSLEWTKDYEILVQEGAHTRRFINLSGGEQMCAALAVRLALLRVLANLDVAFFDEPTTNMDRPRRESLAEAIAGIKTFRQLFVISHDDTFEKVTENVILVQRES